MPNPTCIDCDQPHWARGYCRYHWSYHRKTGELTPLPKKSAEQRFWEKVDKSGDCWKWTARIDRLGYGHFRLDGTMRLAHRVVWVMTNGDIPAGMEIDHRCFTRSCVNPAHLRMVTRKQNMEHQRGAHKHSKTGMRGVVLHKGSGKYFAQIGHYGELLTWGPFLTAEEADVVVRAKRAELFTHDDADY